MTSYNFLFDLEDMSSTVPLHFDFALLTCISASGFGVVHGAPFFHEDDVA
jgi:hypothetical protein